MYLSEVWWAWSRAVAGPLQQVEEVLCGLVNGGAESDDLVRAVEHVQAAMALLLIGTEELHTLELAGVGVYRRLAEDLA